MGVRDEVDYLVEQAKAAPEAARTILSLPREWAKTVRALRGPVTMNDGGIPPGDPVLEPVEGVGFDIWAAVYAGIVRDNVPADRRDAYAQRWSVPPGRWAAVTSVWEHRRRTDYRMAQWAGTHNRGDPRGR